MGRRRKRNRDGRKHILRQFNESSNKQAFESELKRDEFDREQQIHLQNIVERKKDILSRTVFVGSVLGSLRTIETRDALKRFMLQKYGPVQNVTARKGGGKHPMGVVTFNFKSDAEQVFDGLSLLEASKERKQIKVPCSVGFRGVITVRPAVDYKGIYNDDTSTSFIQVNTKGLTLGHWYPQGSDACNDIQGLESIACDLPNTWIQEGKDTSNVKPIMKIDVRNAVVELDVTHCVNDPLDSLTLLVMTMMARSFTEKRTIISFRFKDLTHPMKLCHNNGRYYLLFELRHPPRLAFVTINTETDFETRCRLTGLDELPELGNCLGYRLETDKVEIQRLMEAQAFEKLKRMGLCNYEFDLFESEDVQLDYVRNKKIDVNDYVAKLSSQRMSFLICSILDANSCSWFDMVDDKVMDQDIISLVKNGDSKRNERILNEMREMHGKTRYPAQMFYALYGAEADSDEVTLVVPQFCVSLPRILITPLQIRATALEVEMSNRIVRKFIERHSFSNEAFIRVSIGDENTDNLYSHDLSQQVEMRIKGLVLNGIRIGKKKYYFLAYSSSQLKEQALWMVSPEHGWTVKKMRESMGDFSMCKSPSKYAARIGQCFSTTLDATSSRTRSDEESLLNWTKTRLGLTGRSTPRVNDALPDIVSTNGMEHSDGVGLISRSFMDTILQQLPFNPNPHDISAVQIRYGGAKGVLVAWDFSKLKNRKCIGYDVCLRPSMVKFNAPYDNIEIVTIARRIPYYLNRNVILLGQHHKIPARTFIDLQEHHIHSLNRMLCDASFALKFLYQLNGPDNALMNTLHHMLCVGMEPQEDPFLYSCLHCIRSHHLMNLRKKARIYVERGAVLIGGIDELGLIPENCCFIQVSTPDQVSNKDDYKPITGKVMVTKHPVMHPGDMRMLTAVDIPELRGHKNVILFSQKGIRPEADKMSGSDLDGDQFAITWDSRLFLKINVEPMDFTPAKAPDKNNNINDESLLDHFINHARSSNLGRISMLWIDYATIKEDAGCSECLELAKLASLAVDFPKSGIPAVLPKELVLAQSIPRAHWRELKGRPSFHCTSAVGMLYDQVVNEMNSTRIMPKLGSNAMGGRYRDTNGQILFIGDKHHIFQSKKCLFSPVLAGCLGWKCDDFDAKLLDFANHQRFLYDSQLIELMNQYKIKSEGEVVTGCILKYHKLHKRRRHDIAEEIRRQFRSIRRQFRHEFLLAVYHILHNHLQYFEDDDGLVEEDVPDEELDLIETAATATTVDTREVSQRAKQTAGRVAAAYYVATYSPSTHDDESKIVLFSFPWVIAADVMA